MALLVGAGQARADLLYSQPSNFGMPGASGFASQNDPTGLGNFATVYDNFTLGAAATINNVTWQGLYFNPAMQGPITLAFPPQWGWHSGTGGDSRAIQDFQGSRMVLASDMAFTLNGPGGAVPEPGSVLLLSLGAIGLAGYGWRRQTRVV